MADRFLLTPFFLDAERDGLAALGAPDWEVNRPALPDGRTREERLACLYAPLAAFTAGAVMAGNRPVSVAGDCCTAIGVLAGLQRAALAPTLLWLDAHGDFNTWETTPSGFLGGMPLAMLTGRGDQTIAAGVGLAPLPDQQVILTDGRDLDPGERDLLAASQVCLWTDPARLLAGPLPTGPLYVHFDCDILDPADAPAHSYPAPGGPPVTLLADIFDRLAASGQVVAVSLSAWHPGLPGAAQSKRVVLDLLGRLLA